MATPTVEIKNNGNMAELWVNGQRVSSGAPSYIQQLAQNYGGVSQSAGSAASAPAQPATQTGKTAVTLGNGQVVYVDNQGNFSNANGQPMTNTQVAGGQQAAAPAPQKAAFDPTGNPNLDSILQGLQDFVTKNIAAGNVVNPNLQITPDLASQFLQQAHSQVDPYYQAQINQEIAGINQNLQTLSTQYQNDQANTQATFQQNIAQERNQAGANGVAFSGGRGLTEQNALAAQNRTLSNLDTTYAQNMGNVLRAAAAKIGNNNLGLSGNLNSFQLPTMVGQQATLEGARGGAVQGNALNFGYNPSDYTYGSITAGQGGYGSALTQTANQFLSNYQKSAANNSTGQSFQNINGSVTLQ